MVGELESKLKANLKELKTAENDKSYFLDLVEKKAFKIEDIKSKMTEITTKITSKKINIDNLRNQLDSIVKSASEDNADLVNIPSLSFIDKVEILKKYIKDIKIYYEKPNYFIEIFFNIVNMENSVYILKDNYKVASEVLDIEGIGEQKILIIILDEKLDLEFKNNKEMDLKLMVDSRQQFDKLKLKYIL